MTDKTREEFEAWFTSKRGYGMLSKLPPNTGGYEWVVASEAWEVWQAATAVERERCAKVCEAIGIEARKEWKTHYKAHDDGRSDGANDCAAAIRQGGDA